MSKNINTITRILFLKCVFKLANYAGTKGIPEDVLYLEKKYNTYFHSIYFSFEYLVDGHYTSNSFWADFLSKYDKIEKIIDESFHSYNIFLEKSRQDGVKPTYDSFDVKKHIQILSDVNIENMESMARDFYIQYLSSIKENKYIATPYRISSAIR